MAAAHALACLTLGRLMVLPFNRWATAWCLTALAVAPWIRRYLDHGTDYAMPHYPIRFLAAIPIEYIGGSSLTLIPLGLLIACGLVVVGGRSVKLRKPVEGSALLCWFAIPPILMYTYSWIGQPIFGPSRYHLFVAPAYLLLVAGGLAAVPRFPRLAIAVAMFALTAHSLSAMTDAPARKADWRSLADWLDRRGEQVRVVVVPHDPRFPREPFEAARYYLENQCEVCLENSRPALDSNQSPAPDRVEYHAHCCEPSWKPAEDEVVAVRFHGLTITRSLRTDEHSRTPKRGDGR
jgi:hypothetical protein